MAMAYPKDVLDRARPTQPLVNKTMLGKVTYHVPPPPNKIIYLQLISTVDWSKRWQYPLRLMRYFIRYLKTKRPGEGRIADMVYVRLFAADPMMAEKSKLVERYGFRQTEVGIESGYQYRRMELYFAGFRPQAPQLPGGQQLQGAQQWSQKFQQPKGGSGMGGSGGATF